MFEVEGEAGECEGESDYVGGVRGGNGGGETGVGEGGG